MRAAWRARGLAVLLLAATACSGESPPARLSEPPSAPRPLHVHWVGDRDADGPLLVLLHGYGAPGDDLVPFARSLAARHPGLRVALPEAPLERGSGGRAWWDIELGSRPADRSAETPSGLVEARRDLMAVLQRLRSEGRLDPDRTVLAGFSQGAMMSLDTALDLPFPLAGVGMLSGGPVDRARWVERMRVRAPSSVFLSHGRSDPILAFDAALRLSRTLSEEGSPVRWLAFDGGHQIPASVRAGFAAWLHDVL